MCGVAFGAGSPAGTLRHLASPLFRCACAVGPGLGVWDKSRAWMTARWPPVEHPKLNATPRRPCPLARQVNLALLESSGIAGAVAQLRNHRNASIALKADDIVHRWRTAAVAALTQATGKSR